MTARLYGAVNADDIQLIVGRSDLWGLEVPGYVMDPCTLTEEAIEACRVNRGRLRVRVITINHGFEGSVLPLLDLADTSRLQEIHIWNDLVNETNCQQIAEIVNQCPNLNKLNMRGPAVGSVVAAMTTLPISLGLTMTMFTDAQLDLIVPKFNSYRGNLSVDCRLYAEEWEESLDALHRFLRKVQFAFIDFRTIQPTGIAWDGEYWAQKCTRAVRRRMETNQHFLSMLKSGRLANLPMELRREVYIREVGPWTIDFSDYASHSKYDL